MMTKKTKKTVIMLILFLSGLILPSFPFVKADDLLHLSTIQILPSPVYSLSNCTVTITAQGDQGLVEGASVGIHVEGGEFPDSTNIHNDTTPANGVVTVQWRAPRVDHNTQYNFTATLIKDTNKTVLQASVMVQPVTFVGSTFEADPPAINENEATTITVTALNNGEFIEGANIQITGVGGTFTDSGSDVTTGVSDSNGEFSDIWNAPSVADVTEYVIALEITYDLTNWSYTDELNVTVNPVEGALFYELSVTPGYDLGVGQIATIEVTVRNSTDDSLVENAMVTFIAIEGNFTENNMLEYSVLTDSNGIATAHWNTSVLTPQIGGTDYYVFINITMIGLISNDTTLMFHVTEYVGTLTVDVTSTTTTLTHGESVEVIILVLIDSTPVENAQVELRTQTGNFTGVQADTITGFTNETGHFTAVWDTQYMIMGGDTINNTLTITVKVFPTYIDGVISYYYITVDPIPTTTDPNGDTPFYLEWWFIVAVGGGIVIIGAIIIFARKRPA
jgi:hypothetical protein